ncbi:glycosyltransferase family protein [Pararhodonellum marinum]|uniref:hypothetical protein n=1 Tax=Pararhodonellum marinum TaxID=2755358 RepID=UPI00188FC9F6|nr:hypothetical protein [Pararhodonellum marinum]
MFIPFSKYKWVDKIGDFFNISRLDLQIRALQHINKVDIVYGPYGAATTKLFLLLKYFKLISKPVIISIHYPLIGSDSNKGLVRKIGKKLFQSYDATLFLSKNIMKSVSDNLNLDKEFLDNKAEHIIWGADVEFYEKFIPAKSPKETQFFITNGQTARDFDTLVEAFRHIDFPLKIYCTPKNIPTVEIPSNVTVISDGNLTNAQLLEEYNNSRAILVSYKMVQESTVGLTSLVEGMAMGKPVFMTANKNIDIDLEKEGIGKFIKEGDVEGWVKAISSVANDEVALKKMGANAYNLFREKYNSQNFANHLGEVIKRLLKKEKQISH